MFFEKIAKEFFSSFLKRRKTDVKNGIEIHIIKAIILIFAKYNRTHLFRMIGWQCVPPPLSVSSWFMLIKCLLNK